MRTVILAPSFAGSLASYMFLLVGIQYFAGLHLISWKTKFIRIFSILSRTL